MEYLAHTLDLQEALTLRTYRPGVRVGWDPVVLTVMTGYRVGTVDATLFVIDHSLDCAIISSQL